MNRAQIITAVALAALAAGYSCQTIEQKAAAAAATRPLTRLDSLEAEVAARQAVVDMDKARQLEAATYDTAGAARGFRR